MSTITPTVPESQPSTINLNDPRLTESLTHTTINDLCASLPSARADYARSLDAHGHTAWALGQANCMRYGKATTECPHQHFGQGRRARCHDTFCTIDGRRSYRLHPWVLTRSESVLTERQVGIELIIPNAEERREGSLGSVSALPADRDMLASRSRRRRDAAAQLSTRFLHALALDGVAHDVIAPNEDRDTRVRIAVHAKSLNYSATLTLLHTLNPLARLELKRDQPARDLLLWVFAGIEPALMLSGEYRVALRVAFKGARLIRTVGDFYSRLPEAEIRAQHEKHAAELAEGRHCPICAEQMRAIPAEEQSLEPVEDIESRYERFSWNEEYISARIPSAIAAPDGIVSRGGDRNNSEWTYRNYPNPPTVYPSPPPW